MTNHFVTSLAFTDPHKPLPLLVGQRFGQLLLWNGHWSELASPRDPPHGGGAIVAIAVQPGEAAYAADLGATIESNKTIARWSLRGENPSFAGAKVEIASAGNTADIRLRLSQNGRKLAVIQSDDAGRLVGLQVLNANDMRPVTRDEDSPNSERIAADPFYGVRNAGLLDVAMSPNGEVVLGIANGNQLNEWHAQDKAWRPHRSAERLQATAAELREMSESSALKRIEFIDNARILVSGDGIVLEWNLDTGQLVHRIQSRAPIEAVSVIPAALDEVATISADGRYTRWERAADRANYRLATQQLLTDLGHVRAVTSPDASRALLAITELGGDSASLEVIELATGERNSLTTIPGRVLALTWAGAGQRVAVAFRDAAGAHVSILDATSKQSVANISWEMPEPPVCLALDRDGRSIAIGAGDKIYYAAEPNWNDIQSNPPVGHKVMALAFSPSGRRLAIGDENGNITLRAIETPDTAQEATGDENNASRDPVERTVMLLTGHDVEISQLTFAGYQNSPAGVLVSGDVHGQTLVHLTSDEKPTVSNPQPTTTPLGEVAR
jgi:WD40 repeat protein